MSAKKRVVTTWDEDDKPQPWPYDSKIIQFFDRIEPKVYFKKMRKPMDGEEIVLSPETELMLTKEAATCFLCVMILEDHKKNGKLTGYPLDVFGKATFPIEAKMRHVKILKLYAKPAPAASPPPQEGQE